MDIQTAWVLFLMILELALIASLGAILVSNFISGIHGAPYVPMHGKLIHGLLVFGEVKPEDILYDLGSGDGRVLRSAVKDFHVARAIGYEAAPWPYWRCRWLNKRSGLPNITVRNQNFFDADLRDATFIYAYLLTKLVDKLATKFGSELKSGTRLIIPSFPIDLAKHPQFQLKKSSKIGNITAYLYVKN
jgi:hypothetical protein